uniref:Alpha-macroglobulin receptor-binding domain-containing protein n=1 Tax=Dendroctonus ponderosae TaxID=77166 RepID=A0AAR5PF43_DENPD
MAVMELALPSGFQADRPSLYELVDGGTAANIKMFEEKGDQINIYFTSLGRSSVCFTIKISENLPVENRKGSLVKLYDYYRPEQNVLRFYSLVNNCSRSGLEQDRERGRPKRSSHLDGELEAPHCR